MPSTARLDELPLYDALEQCIQFFKASGEMDPTRQMVSYRWRREDTFHILAQAFLDNGEIVELTLDITLH